MEFTSQKIVKLNFYANIFASILFKLLIYSIKLAFKTKSYLYIKDLYARLNLTYL
jgi:hypothetical protein